MRMKLTVLPLALAVTCVLWTACGTIEDVPDEAASDLEQGLRGEGEIVKVDQPNDPFIE